MERSSFQIASVAVLRSSLQQLAAVRSSLLHKNYYTKLLHKTATQVFENDIKVAVFEYDISLLGAC